MKRNIFKDYWQKVVRDYYEYWSYLVSIWNVQSDDRLIRRAKLRAKIKNANDNRTYYILRDKTGGINELNKSEINMLVRAGVFIRRSHIQILHDAISIVTNNNQVKEEYAKISAEKEGKNE